MAVRQRKPLVVPEEATHPLFDRPIFRKFCKLDVYAQPTSEVRKRTAVGGVISVIAVFGISFLMTLEFYHYIVGTEAYQDQLAVDMGIATKVPININITFPLMQCQDLHLDVLDSTGGHVNNVQTDMYKSPVDQHGVPIFKGQYRSVPLTKNGEAVPLDPRDDPSSPSFCGKCYIEPAGRRYWFESIVQNSLQRHMNKHHNQECCNSCEQVMEMYDKHRIQRPKEEEVEQCLHGLFMKNPGCNIRGTLYVQKVKGNFHFAPGISLDDKDLAGLRISGANLPHLHAYSADSAKRFNPSHKILHLSFGDHSVHRINKRGVVHPLDGADFNIKGDSSTTMKYFIKVVPTTYQIGSGKTERSYEFAVTKHSKVYVEHSLTSSTGVYFVYDFYPIKIAHKFRRMPFLHFLVKISGLVGGLFVVTGMLDAVLGWAVALRNRFVSYSSNGENL